MKVTSLDLKYFKSIQNLKVQFDKRVTINSIYGSNGSGKTTILESFVFLDKLFSLKPNLIMKRFMDTAFSDEEQDKEFISSRFLDWRFDYKRFYTLGFEEDLELEIDFLIEESEYKYSVILGKNEIIKKEILTKGKKIIFKIDRSNESHHSGNLIIYNREKNIYDLIGDKFNKDSKGMSIFNKISMVPLLRLINEFIPQNDEVIKIIEILAKAFPNQIEPERSHLGFHISRRNFKFKINAFDIESAKKTDRYERAENNSKDFFDFITKFDDSIKGYELKIKEINRRERYSRHSSINVSDEMFLLKSFEVELHLHKIIGGKTVSIPYSIESEGTAKYKSLYEVYEKLLSSNHEIIVIDEIGNSINETMLLNVYNTLLKVAKENDKQLFVTSHNAILLSNQFIEPIEDSKLWNKSKWIVKRNEEGVTTMTDLKNRHYKENNHIKFIMGIYTNTKLNYPEKD